MMNKLKLLCFIGVLQVIVSLLTINDQWLEARGETSIREWIRPELRIHKKSMTPIPRLLSDSKEVADNSGNKSSNLKIWIEVAHWLMAIFCGAIGGVIGAVIYMVLLTPNSKAHSRRDEGTKQPKNL